MCLYELSTYIFFDILGFDGFKGVVCRIQHSKQKTVIKHTYIQYICDMIYIQKYYALVICKQIKVGELTVKHPTNTNLDTLI